MRQALLVEDLGEAALDPSAERVDLFERVGVLDDRQCLHRGRRRDPVACVRAAVADVVGQDAHHLVGAAKRRRRVAVAHRLGVRREVRGHPEELGGATAGEPEAGLHLVEDQQRPEFLRQRPDRLVEARLGHDRLGVAEDRLDDHAGDVGAVALEDPAKHVHRVVAGRDHRPADGLRDAPAPRQGDRVLLVAELRHVVRGDADQGVIVDAVVLALELHDLVAAGVCPGDAHRVHRGLGAGHGHPGLLDPAGQLLDELDRADLVLARQREADALPHPLVDVVVDPVVAVAEDHRAVAHAKVDELVAVDVPDRAALASIDVDGALAPCPEVRVRAAREALERALVERQLALPAKGRRGAGRGRFGRHDHSIAAAAGARGATAVAGGGTVGMSWWHTADHGVNADIVVHVANSCDIRSRSEAFARDALLRRTVGCRA